MQREKNMADLDKWFNTIKRELEDEEDYQPEEVDTRRIDELSEEFSKETKRDELFIRPKK